MQPHTVALINIAAYMHNGGTGRSFRVDVRYKDLKYYTIDVSGSGSSFTCHVNGRWSCYATVRLEGSKVVVRHQHRETTHVEETCWLSVRSIDGGRIEHSQIKDGSFSGSIRENGKDIEVRASTTGQTYQSRIQSVS